MHEAGLVAEALSDALRTPPGGRRGRPHPRALEAVVTDPVDVSAESIELHLEIALRRMGLADVPIDVQVLGVECPVCGAQNRPDPGWAFCDVCSLPLPRQPGSAVRIRARW